MRGDHWPMAMLEVLGKVHGDLEERLDDLALEPDEGIATCVQLGSRERQPALAPVSAATKAKALTVAGFGMQDGSLQESMGPIVDRTRENLVPTDYGIVMARNRLRKAATDLRDKGIMPPGRDPEHMKTRSISVLLDPELNYAEACREDMVAAEGKIRATV